MPALKDNDNQSVLQSKDKTDLFVDTFSKKHVLNDAIANEYTQLLNASRKPQGELKSLRLNDAKAVMDKLRIDSGTGPDLLPARILKC